MKEIKEHYFKLSFDEGRGQTLISGLPLPDPSKGPYKFVDCDIHPRLWTICRIFYAKSEFAETYIGKYLKISLGGSNVEMGGI